MKTPNIFDIVIIIVPKFCYLQKLIHIRAVMIFTRYINMAAVHIKSKKSFSKWQLQF